MERPAVVQQLVDGLLGQLGDLGSISLLSQVMERLPNAADASTKTAPGRSAAAQPVERSSSTTTSFPRSGLRGSARLRGVFGADMFGVYWM